LAYTSVSSQEQATAFIRDIGLMTALVIHIFAYVYISRLLEFFMQAVSPGATLARTASGYSKCQMASPSVNTYVYDSTSARSGVSYGQTNHPGRSHIQRLERLPRSPVPSLSLSRPEQRVTGMIGIKSGS
jgi:hypothetical protein